MLESERDILRGMTGSDPTPEVRALFGRVRKNLLSVGNAFAMSNETLAVIAAVAESDDFETHEEEQPEAVEEQPMVAPADELSQEQLDDLAAQNKYTGGRDDSEEYVGERLDWVNPFPGITPQTPLDKVPKDYPLTYISPKDSRRYSGKLVKIDPRDPNRVIVSSSEQKKNFGVDRNSVALSDLRRPSTMPRAVQI
jgi:hypothetical protein